MHAPKLLRIYDDGSLIGCGYREVLIYAVGRVWARGVSPASGKSFRVPVSSSVLRLAADLGEINRRKLRSRLRANAKCFGNESRAVKAALAALR